ncbi:hypothetical protein KIPB_012449 [Kipferlia bialata]|uniref:Uncharacterized protein n=1 Tax=Kipferlia bialata TaxID=797122 RepID=A0A391NV92_9EUKA|nr:hypothetical protein KIPB_012449 [Kipferlia bialata]|eukprot:g12449.t1
MLIGDRSIALGLMTETDWIAVTTAMRASRKLPFSAASERRRTFAQLFSPCQKWTEHTLRRLKAKIRTGSY